METIKSNREISDIFSCGKRYSNSYVAFVVKARNTLPGEKETQHGHTGRVAFIAGKKHGNAVWRNSAKRRLREIYRLSQSDLTGVDVLFIARPAIMKASYSKVSNACEQTLKRISSHGRQ